MLSINHLVCVSKLRDVCLCTSALCLCLQLSVLWHVWMEEFASPGSTATARPASPGDSASFRSRRRSRPRLPGATSSPSTQYLWSQTAWNWWEKQASCARSWRTRCSRCPCRRDPTRPTVRLDQAKVLRPIGARLTRTRLLCLFSVQFNVRVHHPPDTSVVIRPFDQSDIKLPHKSGPRLFPPRHKPKGRCFQETTPKQAVSWNKLLQIRRRLEDETCVFLFPCSSVAARRCRCWPIRRTAAAAWGTHGGRTNAISALNCQVSWIWITNTPSASDPHLIAILSRMFLFI